MKKQIQWAFVVVLAMGISGAFAAEKKPVAAAAPVKRTSWERPYGLAGCGLGNLAFGKKSQVLAATTNGTFYSQLFGITTGTSNCQDGPTEEVAGRMDKFIIANKVALASDIARGDGETIQGLTQLMGCQMPSQALGTQLKANFTQIFPSAEVQANEVTDSIITVIKNDERLVKSCPNIV